MEKLPASWVYRKVELTGLLEGEGGCETEERRMIPRLFVPRAGRMELPSVDEGGCGGRCFGGRSGSWYWMCSFRQRPLDVQTDMDESAGQAATQLEASVWEMSVMELLGTSSSLDVSQRGREEVQGPGLCPHCSDAGAKRRTLQRRLRRKGQCITAGGTHPQHFGGSVPCQVSQWQRGLVC